MKKLIENLYAQLFVRKNLVIFGGTIFALTVSKNFLPPIFSGVSLFFRFLCLGSFAYLVATYFNLKDTHVGELALLVAADWKALESRFGKNWKQQNAATVEFFRLFNEAELKVLEDSVAWTELEFIEKAGKAALVFMENGKDFQVLSFYQIQEIRLCNKLNRTTFLNNYKLDLTKSQDELPWFTPGFLKNQIVYLVFIFIVCLVCVLLI